MNGSTMKGYAATNRDLNGQMYTQRPQGSVLSAHDISYSVKVTSTYCRTTDKQILFNITGIFKQGLTAILGPTGSGKSTLLDVLAGRKDSKGVSGHLLLDGQPLPHNVKCLMGYVVQDDVVMSTLSVRENLAFSAALRLPSSMTPLDRQSLINKIIRELGLDRCADTKVGDEFIPGVSGGERKRCSIGMELIISPPVLFLDEPTTGLDSSTASTILFYLKRISRNGRTIILSIHQPRYSIYSLFDSLMLLSQGRTVYHGPSHEALDFFATQGFLCEEHNNPPDFFLDVINGDLTTFGSEMRIDNEARLTDVTQTKQDILVEGFKYSLWNKRLQEEIHKIVSAFQENFEENNVTIDYVTSFVHQLTVVGDRAVKNLIRHPQTCVITVTTSLVLAVITAAIFWQLNEDPNKAFQDRAGVLFFLVNNHVFTNVSALGVFIHGRKLFMHENIGGFYRVSVFFLVKIVLDIIPLRMIPVIIFSGIVYFAVGLNSGADHFFQLVSCLFCTTVASASLCFLISAVIRNFTVAQALLNLCYILMMLLGGFFINFNSIGPWLNWAQYLSLFKYAQT
ncbi:ATP-binding cassette sub-family G member 2-like isoform X1, partial [Biomphalaria glabrata]